MNNFQVFAVNSMFETGFTIWLAVLKLMADLTIVAAIASVVCALYSLTSRSASGLPAPRWLVITFMTGIGICGICHFARAIGFGPPPDISPGPTFMRVAVAAFWVAFAVQLPAMIDRLVQPLAKQRFTPLNVQPLKDLADLADHINTQAQTTESFVRNDLRSLTKSEMPRQIGETFADRETDPCKI
jgi:hypothetical protein